MRPLLLTWSSGTIPKNGLSDEKVDLKKDKWIRNNQQTYKEFRVYYF